MESLEAFESARFGARALEPFERETHGCADEAFALRSQLLGAGFVEGAIAKMLKLAVVQTMDGDRAALADEWLSEEGGIGDLVRAFVLHRPVESARLEAALSPDSVAFAERLGLLRPCDGALVATVSMFWLDDVLVATDAWLHEQVWPGQPRFDDRVMYIGADSVGLALLAPRARRKSVLDLCTGSGVQALVAARSGAIVVGVDLNPRAVRFARFNAALNGITNAQFRQGDLFAPVADERFDQILANPPFVPLPPGQPPLAYRDAGPRGEDVLRRIVAGASAHLLPDGNLVVAADFPDVDTLPERISQWRDRRPSRIEIFLEQELPIAEYAEGHAAAFEDVELRRSHAKVLFAHLRDCVTSMHFGYVIVDELPTSAISPPTVTHQLESPVYTPIFEHVDRIRTSRRLLNDGFSDDWTLAACEELVLELHLWAGDDETLVSTPLARIGGDQIFETIALDANELELIRIALTQPLEWASIVGAGLVPSAKRLLERGLLELTNA